MTRPFKLFSLCVALCVAILGPTTVRGEQKVSYTEPTKPMEFQQGKKYFAVIHTSKGDITCELFASKAPISVTNFIMLANGGFYDGLTFHRVVPGFVIQGGDPTGTGSGGPGYTIVPEIGMPHEVGALAWARLP